jgi:AICAR transformylase/IMP cyclohydrolase PurH
MYNLRYGENPHQHAALYVEKVAGRKPCGITQVKRHSGPELSFNNFLDIDAAWNVVSDFRSRPWLLSSTPIHAAFAAMTTLPWPISGRWPATP